MFLNLKPSRMTLMCLKNFSLVVFNILISFIIPCRNDKKSQFELSSLFSDEMVLQRATLVSILEKFILNQKINIPFSWGFDTTKSSDSSGYQSSVENDSGRDRISLVVHYVTYMAKRFNKNIQNI